MIVGIVDDADRYSACNISILPGPVDEHTFEEFMIDFTENQLERYSRHILLE